MRDWTKTLYPASWRGLPFWVEHDATETGRRLNITDIPGADDPFIEDLGAKHRPIEIDGYYISDFSDAEMIAFENAINTKGAGTLVMPAQGPLTARGDHCKRSRFRDKMGRIGFTARFILDPRSGFANPTASYPADYLAQRAFDANDGLAAALGGLLGGLRV
jgi:hypothetical protein